jgi:hypothetical protein
VFLVHGERLYELEEAVADAAVKLIGRHGGPPGRADPLHGGTEATRMPRRTPRVPRTRH